MVTRRKILTGAAACVALLSGPFSRPARASNVSLNIFFAPANLSSVYNAVFQAFMASNPGISIIGKAFSSYGDLLQENMRAIVTRSLPDISHDGLNVIRRYVERKVAHRLDDLISDDPTWRSGFDAGFTDRIGSIQGSSFAVPFAVSTPTIFFNLDLVKRAGGDILQLPTEWKDIIALGKRISTLDPNISGIYFDYGASGGFAFQTLLYSQGGQMMTADEKALLLGSPTGENAMEVIRQFGEAGQIDMSRDNARQAFISGTLGIYQNTSSNLGNFDAQIADRFQYSMTPVPITKDGLIPAAGNGMLLLSTDERRREAAWKYIKFASGPIAQALMARRTGYVPINKNAFEEEELRKFYQGNPRYTVPLDQLKSLTHWYSFPGANGTKAMDVLTAAMGRVITLRESSNTALLAAERDIGALLGI